MRITTEITARCGHSYVETFSGPRKAVRLRISNAAEGLCPACEDERIGGIEAKYAHLRQGPSTMMEHDAESPEI